MNSYFNVNKLIPTSHSITILKQNKNKKEIVSKSDRKHHSNGLSSQSTEKTAAIFHQNRHDFASSHKQMQEADIQQRIRNQNTEKQQQKNGA